MQTSLTTLAGRRVLLGVTGGIAAYKAADLTRRFKEVGADVPTTNMLGAGAKRSLPKAPTNLGFYPGAPK